MNPHNYDAFVFDCDGVVWSGDSAIEGAAETMRSLRTLGKKVFFYTNSSARSRTDYVEKFTNLGIRVSLPQIHSSAYSTALYLISQSFSELLKSRNRNSSGKLRKVYVVGGPGLIQELSDVGLDCIGGADDASKFYSPTEMALESIDPDVDVVVVGFDSGFNYYKLCYAAQCVMNGAFLVCTNKDSTYPWNGKMLPANGCFVRAVEAASGKEADVVAGKPNPLGLRLIMETNNLEPSKVLMVGDRLDTDIEFGNLAGADTLLVFSGCTSRQDLEAVPNNSNQKPKHTADSIAILHTLINHSLASSS